MGSPKESIINSIADGSIETEISKPFEPDEAIVLVEKCKEDAGAAFERETLLRLVATKTEDMANFMRLRAQLKGVKVSIGELDKALEATRARSESAAADAEDNAGPGSALSFPDVEPWHEPVDGGRLLGATISYIRRFVGLSTENATAVALWIINAFCFNNFDHSPRLFITSPEKRCGKTTLLRIVQALVPRPLGASNITAAAMFRTIEKYRPTLLIDEADTFLRDNEELRGIINSGHERAGSVIRLVGDDHEPRAFSTFCPTAIAAIGSAHGTIEDRSFIVALRRRLPTEPIEKRNRKTAAQAYELKRKMLRWVADHEHELRTIDPATPDALNDRAGDNWRGALAIADIVGGEWPDKVRASAVSMMQEGESRHRPSGGVMLLSDIRRIFEARRKDGDTDAGRISSTGLEAALVVLDNSPWATWSRGRPITSARVAAMLKEFDVLPRTVKLANGKQPNGYQLEQFKDAFERYLPPASQMAPERSPSSPTNVISEAYPLFVISPAGGSGEGSFSSQEIEKSGNGEVGELVARNRGLSWAKARLLVDQGDRTEFDWAAAFGWSEKG
jgi:putative DNA primase/helicase